MFELPFRKMSPGGNTTILIMGAGVPPENRAPIASRLMDPLHLHAEQVGFIDLDAPLPRIDMMGGEFCGNACRCLAALLLHEGRISTDHEGSAEGCLASSGIEAPVSYRVRRADSHGRGIDASIRMPLPATLKAEKLFPGVHLVRLPGISHLLFDLALHPYPEAPKPAVAEALARHGLDGEPAAGCIWHGSDAKGVYILPVVHVRATASTHEETACGSGTLALALLLSGDADALLEVRQPSGEVIRATVTRHADHAEAWMGGPVQLVAQGTAYVECP